jgi:transposase-like protein
LVEKIKFRAMKQRKNKGRTFSNAFKKEKVKMIDEGKLSVRQVSDIYDVSTTAVYNWLRKFSRFSKDERIVVEKISEAQKNKELQNQIRDLEQAVGRKQLELDYYKEVVKVTSETLGEDIEKKYKPKQ